MSYWVAVHTWPMREARVVERLRSRHSLPVVFPFVRVRAQRKVGRDQRVVVHERPYFPRYLFVRAADRALSWIRDTWEVSGVVASGGTPLRIPDAVVARVIELQRRDEAVGEEDFTRPWDTRLNRLPKGALVRINGEGNPLQGLMAALAGCERLMSHGEVRVFVDLLGGRRSVRVPAADLELV